MNKNVSFSPADSAFIDPVVVVFPCCLVLLTMMGPAGFDIWTVWIVGERLFECVEIQILLFA